MRTLMAVALLMACGRSTLSQPSDGLLLMPQVLDFGTRVVGSRERQTVAVSNGGAAPRSLALSTEAPFATAQSLQIGRGESVELLVDFAPTAPGAYVRTLSVGSSTVELRGVGVESPVCIDGPCDDATVDEDTGDCVRRPLDGTVCTDACIVGGTCRQGLCAGPSRSCDDGNVCTIDGCAADGCHHVAVTCDAPTDPCQAALCDPTLGCRTVAVADGTSCAASLCQAQGQCLNQRCVRPSARTLSPRWTYHSSNQLHFTGVSDSNDNVYFVECDSRCRAVSLNSAGSTRFRTELPGLQGRAARIQSQLLESGVYLLVMPPSLVAVRASDGVLLWSQAVSMPVLTAGLATAHDGSVGWLVSELLDDVSQIPPEIELRVFEVQTGRVRLVTTLAYGDEASRPVVDEDSRAWLREGPSFNPTLRVVDANGAATSRPLRPSLEPVAVFAGQLVLSDQSIVRGGVVLPAPAGSTLDVSSVLQLASHRYALTSDALHRSDASTAGPGVALRVDVSRRSYIFASAQEHVVLASVVEGADQLPRLTIEGIDPAGVSDFICDAVEPQSFVSEVVGYTGRLLLYRSFKGIGAIDLGSLGLARGWSTPNGTPGNARHSLQ